MYNLNAFDFNKLLQNSVLNCNTLKKIYKFQNFRRKIILICYNLHAFSYNYLQSDWLFTSYTTLRVEQNYNSSWLTFSYHNFHIISSRIITLSSLRNH